MTDGLVLALGSGESCQPIRRGLLPRSSGCALAATHQRSENDRKPEPERQPSAISKRQKHDQISGKRTAIVQPGSQRTVIRLMHAFIAFLRMTFDPPPHPVAEVVERGAERAEKQTARIEREADAFADMVDGMKQQASHRAKKKSASRRR